MFRNAVKHLCASSKAKRCSASLHHDKRLLIGLLILLIGIAAIGANRAICYRLSASWATVFHELTSNLFQHFGFLRFKFGLCEHTVILEFG